MTDASTPRPWKLHFGDRRGIEFIDDADGRAMITVGDEYEAAALIVQAVNAHDDLVAALQEARAILVKVAPIASIILKIDAALAKAGDP